MDLGSIDIHEKKVSPKNLFNVWLKLIVTVSVVFLIYVALQMLLPSVHPIFISVLAFVLGFIFFRIVLHQEILVFLA